MNGLTDTILDSATVKHSNSQIKIFTIKMCSGILLVGRHFSNVNEFSEDANDLELGFQVIFLHTNTCSPQLLD